ncbi:MAG TPA: hypothetical protein VEX38_09740, partial [Fimbriimonadaceae bacterium]|nr:hypothetical protein [Fimbriimonadaceae bacterium]
MSMFFSGVSKHLPHLSRYLNYVVSRDRLNVGGEGWFAGLVGASTGLGVAAVFGLANAGVISANAPGPSAAILLPLAGIWGGIIAWSARKRRKEQMTPDYRLFQEAGEVAREMHSSLSRRRLHRELHPGVADLLEESARNWCRTM